jgi:hypothetical protein
MPLLTYTAHSHCSADGQAHAENNVMCHISWQLCRQTMLCDLRLLDLCLCKFSLDPTPQLFQYRAQVLVAKHFLSAQATAVRDGQQLPNAFVVANQPNINTMRYNTQTIKIMH